MSRVNVSGGHNTDPDDRMLKNAAAGVGALPGGEALRIINADAEPPPAAGARGPVSTGGGRQDHCRRHDRPG